MAVSLFRKNMENDMESAFSEAFNIHIDGYEVCFA